MSVEETGAGAGVAGLDFFLAPIGDAAFRVATALAQDLRRLGKSVEVGFEGKLKRSMELANKFGLKVLSFTWVQGYRHFFTNKPIRKPEDLKGMRIRTPPAPIWQESVRALGATPVAVAFVGKYPAIQQKAIEGVELVYNNIPAGRFYEVLKYVNETRHIMLINFEAISAKFFNSLPADYQKILVEECDKAGEDTSKQIFKLEAEVKQQLKGRGMIVVEDVNLPAFRKAGEKAYEVLKITAAKDAVYKEIGKK